MIELAVAGNAQAIVARNTRDFTLPRELRFPQLRILTPTRLRLHLVRDDLIA